MLRTGLHLFVSGVMLASTAAVQAGALGVANDYNAFIFQDITASGGDTEGRLAVGGNANLSSYGVGDKLSNSHGTRDDFVVGGNMDALWGWQVFSGNAVYGNSLIHAPTTPNGTVRKDSVIDFAAAAVDLKAKSTSWSTLAANGTSEFKWGSVLYITATDPVLNIIDVDPAQWAAASDRQITAPAGSTVLINIAGTNVSMSGGLELYGVKQETVLYNFYQATSLNPSSIAVLGSVLAPLADLTLSGGNINGVTVVKSAYTRWGGEFHNYGFTGSVPEPATMTLLALGGLLVARKRAPRVAA